MLHRHSSRRQPDSHRFLTERLAGARAYDRIAGYFSSSILELAGEALESVTGKIRVVCNSQLDPRDVATARAANLAIRQEWHRGDPERHSEGGHDRFARLARFLRSGKLEVRVLPDHRFGLIHGKAGVITMADGSETTFLGSANETFSGWKLNYELVWEDASADAVKWVREEFDALWNCPDAFPLAEAVIEDVERISRRTVVPSVATWKAETPVPAPEPALIETPVYRRKYGLWAHQKYFVDLAFRAHQTPQGARFVLADMVGLGKTIQLAMSALVMALWGDKPVLIIAPRPLLEQWQDEMRELLDMPSARWNGRQWIDERGIVQPAAGVDRIRHCPRRVAIVSQGLFTARSEAGEKLLTLDYECVILDEAHRARREKPGAFTAEQKRVPNNLLAAMIQLARRSHSVLLATATPVQIHPIEAWDLLDVLNQGREHVLGNVHSPWRKPGLCLPLVAGDGSLAGADEHEFWDWFRNPVPPSEEGREMESLRDRLDLGPADFYADGSAIENLGPPDRERLRDLRENFARDHNPFLRHIIRRTRDFLETETDPETGQTYLEPVGIRLRGESDPVHCPVYLQQAFELASEFSRLIERRSPGAGFLKTLLLRRLGSSLEAGRRTVGKMLDEWNDDESAILFADEEAEGEENRPSDQIKDLQPNERELLEAINALLETQQGTDPKFSLALDLLNGGSDDGGSWLELGCIVFSQYYDTIEAFARFLSGNSLADEKIGVYAGSGKSAIWHRGIAQPAERDTLKEMVRHGELRLVLGTDAASEGLNLQRLGTLINLDLPWNPTRLEQRKGRIQRIGQRRPVVDIYNMRYQGSVEDRVHEVLSSRLANIRDLFGQIPDTLEDIWIDIALGQNDQAARRLDELPERHPFEEKYNQIRSIDWEKCARVLNPIAIRETLEEAWTDRKKRERNNNS